MSQFISLATASEMTKRLRDHRDSVLKTEYQNQDVLPICETFDRAGIETLLGKSECQQIRIYMGMDASLKLQAVIVAVDSNGADILTSATAATLNSTTEEDDIIDDGFRCPPLCPPDSPLNTD